MIAAAFVAGAAAAVGVNRALDVHLAQAKPQVECEPIFVALRPLPQGVPVTVWDVALRDWPKAMLPATAIRATDSFEGCVLKYPLREGQPLLTAQLVKPEVAPPAASDASAAGAGAELVDETFVPPPPAVEPPPREIAAVEPVPAVTADPQLAPAPTADDGVARREITAQPAGPDEAVAAAAPESPIEPVVDQPTLAPPDVPATSSAAEPVPASAPVATSAPQPTETGRSAGASDAAFDVPSQPPIDARSIPSVMSRSSAAPPADGDAGTPPTGRYLVVPERIARQADTSFTTPSAPEARVASEQPQATNTESPERAASGQPRQAQSPQRQAQARQPQGRPQQQPTRTQQQPTKTQQPGRTQRKAAATEREQPASRGWTAMFPNVSAGLNAIGSWRSRTQEAAVPDRQAPDSGASRR